MGKDESTYKSMTFGQIALHYGISKPTLHKWLKEYLPEIKRVKNSYIFTPTQVKKIIEELG